MKKLRPISLVIVLLVALVAGLSLTGCAPYLLLINVSPPGAWIVAGETWQFTAMGLYSDGKYNLITTKVTWSSSEPDVATIVESGVKGGLATGVCFGGTSYITATLDGITSDPAILDVSATHPAKITIGAARSLSGPLEAIGDNAFGPVLDYWVDEVNAAGGIYVAEYCTSLPVELDIQDDESDISTMVSLLDSMVKSGGYDFVFAPVSTDFLYAAAPICNAYEYILMGAEGGCTSIKDMLDDFPYLFGVLNFADHNQMEELFKLLDGWWETVHDPDTMDIYVIYIDDLHGYEYRDEFAAEAANYPGQFNIVREVAVVPFAEDVSTQLIEADGLNADVFCAFTYPPTTMAVVAQANALGINFDAMVLGWGANFEYFRTLFGDDMLEGVIGLGAWNEDTSAAAAAFAADMITMHSRVYMDWWGQLYYYAGLQCFQQAIERAGTLDQSVIRDILATEHFTTVLGDTWFEDVNGNHPIAEGGGLLAVECHPGQVGQWQSGIFEVIDIGPNNTATGIYPKPDWPTP